MTKIGLITDTHYGIRNDNVAFYNYFSKSNDVFFNTMWDHNVQHIIHLGDYFHNRKSINLLTASMAHDDLGKRLTNFNTHLIIGNHDCYYNNTNYLNSPSLILSDLMNIYPHRGICLYDSPEEIEIDGIPILLLPWINESNHSESLKMIQNTKAQLCFGHLSIQGFVMDQGRVNEDGLSPSLFDKFDFVASGHFHTKSDKGNIHYLGAHCEHTWADYNDPRGFHVFDLQTRELTYFKNSYIMYHMIVFDNMTVDQINDFNYQKYYETYVRVVILNKDDQYLFDMFNNKLHEAGPIDVSTVEGKSVAEAQNINDIEEVNVEDTPAILNNYIDTLQTNLDTVRIKQTMTTIYNEAKVLKE